MSAITPIPRMIQSKPVTPPAATDAHIKVVHGAKMNPRKAQKKFEKAASHRAGSISHQTRIANLGPATMSAEKKQHMMLHLPFEVVLHRIYHARRRLGIAH